jgi:branched-chain amino acid transport system permease protein
MVLSRMSSAAVVVAGVVVVGVLGLGVLPGRVTPYAIALVIAVLAVLALGGRLALPSNPLARHLLLAVVGGALILVLTDHVGTFTDFQFAEVAYYIPAVAGLNVLTGYNGQVSLGHGALMAVGAYTAAVLMVHQPHVAIVVVLVGAVVVTALAGVVVGVAAARLRGPYLAGATLALAVALPELATKYSTVLGGEQGLDLRSLSVPGWLSASFPAERWLAWVGIVSGLVVLVLLANLTRSGVGRRWRTVRDDETAAALAGVNVARTQVLAFVVSSACAGLAGALYGLAASLANPAAFGVTLSFALLTAIVIGGVGSLAGSVWGALALVYIPHYADSVSTHFHFSVSVKDNLPLALYGAILVLAMLAFPEGIQGGLRRLGRLVGLSGGGAEGPAGREGAGRGGLGRGGGRSEGVVVSPASTP